MSVSSNAGRIGVFGRSGSGKSTYTKRLIKARKRVVIFDPLEEYDAKVRVRHVRRDSINDVIRAIAADYQGFRVSYVPPAGDEAEALSKLCWALLEAQEPFRAGDKRTPGLTLVVEEMNNSFPVHGGAENCRGFAEICSRGRHYGIEVIGVSQRIAEVATRFRNNCTETVILAQKGKRDLDAAAELIGGDRQKVMALRNLDYLHEKNGELSSGKLRF